MTVPSRTIFHLFALACLAGALASPASGRETVPPKNPQASSTAVPVKVAADGMLRGGKPYFVKGAGGSGSMQELAARGANSLRTWTTNDLDEILDQADKLGITVSAGIWLEPESSWFSYSNPEHCAKQSERVRKEVMLYKDHPALLAWGLGNEIEGDGNNTALWRQLDKLALLVKELDPAHPTFTSVAGMSPDKAAGMNAHAPHLDFVGINTYGAVFSLRKHLDKIGWKRPWLLTEWGPRGFWESPKSKSGAPLEQTSTEKAEMIHDAYQKVITPDGGCLGSYVFVWGWKFEATATWFGIFTHDGETTAVADTLQKAWGGYISKNRAPNIGKLSGVPNTSLKPGTRFDASAKATDPDGDRLVWHWAVLPETTSHNGHKSPPMPKAVASALAKTTGEKISVKAPAKPGVYRLHVWIKDGKGHAATANVPFEVK